MTNPAHLLDAYEQHFVYLLRFLHRNELDMLALLMSKVTCFILYGTEYGGCYILHLEKGYY